MWYPTHPSTIPFLLANGISLDENGVTLYAKLSSCTHESYHDDDYSLPISIEGEFSHDNLNMSMALLVEVDSVAAEQNTIHEKPNDSDNKVSWRKFPSK